MTLHTTIYRKCNVECCSYNCYAKSHYAECVNAECEGTLIQYFLIEMLTAHRIFSCNLTSMPPEKTRLCLNIMHKMVYGSEKEGYLDYTDA